MLVLTKLDTILTIIGSGIFGWLFGAVCGYTAARLEEKEDVK